MFTNIYLYWCCNVILVASQEQTMQNIEGFDKSNLKPASTEEKQNLPDTGGL